ncbi:unnamed protein product [Caenorhabditis auriculariae]|uniref:Uncharacterized protein n=1 Tax=Caenorhabditis auriculariae TaxID=2777116 RepID=A0A8S1HD87_9PELO|nr:unnamed protein product [Caenorhabditis auriculariae]
MNLFNASNELIRNLNIASGGVNFSVMPLASDQKNEMVKILQTGEIMVVGLEESEIVHEYADSNSFRFVGLSYTLGRLEKIGGFVFAQPTNLEKKRTVIANFFVEVLKVFYQEAHQLPSRIVVQSSRYNNELFDTASFLKTIAKALRECHDFKVFNYRRPYAPELFLVGSMPNHGSKFAVKREQGRPGIGTFGSSRKFYSGPEFSSFWVSKEVDEDIYSPPELYLLSKYRGVVSEEEETLMGMLLLTLSVDQTTGKPEKGTTVARAACTLSQFSGETLLSVLKLSTNEVNPWRIGHNFKYFKQSKRILENTIGKWRSTTTGKNDLIASAFVNQILYEFFAV